MPFDPINSAYGALGGAQNTFRDLTAGIGGGYESNADDSSEDVADAAASNQEKTSRATIAKMDKDTSVGIDQMRVQSEIKAMNSFNKTSDTIQF